MDAFTLLKADHKKVAKLFDQLESASGKAKLGVFKKINDELQLHAHIEEKFLYPALEKPEETHDLTLEAYEEHAVVKTLLAELSAGKSANDEWQAKAKVLRENVEHHVKEEENELFDKADDALSDEQIDAIGQKMEAEKARKQGRPVPKISSEKKSDSNKRNASKPGILSKLANLVGLGTETSKKKAPASKKISAKSKRGAKKSPSATKASKKAGAKKSSKRPVRKSQSSVSSASSSAAKRVKGRTSGAAKSKAGAKPGKKVGKKSGRK